jgi:hypothetical protein
VIFSGKHRSSSRKKLQVLLHRTLLAIPLGCPKESGVLIPKILLAKPFLVYLQPAAVIARRVGQP